MVADKRIPIIFTKDCGYVPAVLVNAGEVIEKHITTKNLFQVQGSTAKVKQLMSILSLQKMPKLRKVHVHDVVEVIKVGLSRLAKELIPVDVMDLLIEANQSHLTDYTAILALFHRTSPLTFAAVHYVMRLLNKVIQNSESNGMDARKLATIFVLDILKPLTGQCQDDPQEYDAFRLHRVERLPYLIMVIEQLILKVSAFKNAATCKTAKIRTCSSLEKIHTKWKYTMDDESEAQCDFDLAEEYTCPHCQLPTSSKHPRFSCCGMDARDGGKMDAELGNNAVAASVSQTEGRLPLPPSRRCSQLGRINMWSGTNKGSNQVKRRSSILKSSVEPTTKHVRTKSSDSKAKKGLTLYLIKSNLKKKKSPIKSKIAARWKGIVGKSAAPKYEPNVNRYPGKSISQKKRKTGKVEELGNPKDGLNKNPLALPFQNDEELMPWTGLHTDSDDSSIMKRTIQQPRFYKSRHMSSAESIGNNDMVTSSSQASMKLSRRLSSERISPDCNKSSSENASPSNDPQGSKSIPSLYSKLVSSRIPCANDNDVSKSGASPWSLSPLEERLRESSSLKRPSPRDRPRSSRKHRHPHYKQAFKQRHTRATILNSRRSVTPKPNKFLEWTTDILLLFLSLFCAYLLFLLLQKQNQVSVQSHVTGTQKKFFGLS